MGIFYELPTRNVGGCAKIRLMFTYNRYRIQDYAFYRDMLVLTGVNPKEGRNNEHVVVSADGKAAVWLSLIDDF